MVQTSVGSASWASNLSLSLHDVRDGATAEFPFHAPGLPDPLDLSDEPHVIECNERHGQGAVVNTNGCTVNGVSNGCSLEAGCETVAAKLRIENPRIDDAVSLDWQLIKPDGSHGFSFSYAIDLKSNWTWAEGIFFVGVSKTEIWESGTYTIQLRARGPDGKITTGRATFTVQHALGSQGQDRQEEQGKKKKQAALEDHPDEQTTSTPSPANTEAPTVTSTTSTSSSSSTPTVLGLPQDTVHTVLTIVLASLIVAAIQEAT